MPIFDKCFTLLSQNEWILSILLKGKQILNILSIRANSDQPVQFGFNSGWNKGHGSHHYHWPIRSIFIFSGVLYYGKAVSGDIYIYMH